MRTELPIELRRNFKFGAGGAVESLFAALFALLACGGIRTVDAQPALRQIKQETGPAETELRIVSTEFSFNPLSKPLIVGRPVIIVFDNSQGETEHSIAAPALGLRLFARAGEVVKKIHTFEKKGEFEFVCDLPGHLEAGMKGKLSVIAGQDAQSKQLDAAKLQKLEK